MANWYVSDKVASSGAGTSLAVAFKTIAEAITAASANDIINVYDGIYSAFTATKPITINGIGYVEINGQGVASYCITKNAISGNLILNNLYCKNAITGSYNEAANSATDQCKPNFCVFTQDFKVNQQETHATYCIFSTFTRTSSRSITLTACTFLGNADLQVNVGGHYLNLVRRCTFQGNALMKNLLAWDNNNLNNSQVTFNGGTASLVTDVASLESKYLSELLVPAASPILLNTTEFVVPAFNNSANNNYTLQEGSDLEANMNRSFIGAYNVATNIICKDTANGGDCDIYNISTDVYSLGIFAGITNVAAIDNINEKLYRSSTGANNWAVFVASSEFLKTRIVKNWLSFGGLIGSLGQTSKLPADFAYNYQIDVLIKWSDTLSKAALLAETSIPFVRFRYRPNENNYYVNNSGTLVGDGEPTYLSLVNSSDGGSGSLVPQKIISKSQVFIIILRDL